MKKNFLKNILNKILPIFLPGIPFLIIILFFTPNYAHAAFAGGVFKQGVCYIFGWMEGELGALLAVASGVVAVIMGSVGNFKGAAGFVMTAIGAFTISNSVEFYFGDFGCSGPQAATPVRRESVIEETTQRTNSREVFSAVSQLPHDDAPPSFPERGNEETEQF